jgi:hypothetical protein
VRLVVLLLAAGCATPTSPSVAPAQLDLPPPSAPLASVALADAAAAPASTGASRPDIDCPTAWTGEQSLGPVGAFAIVRSWREVYAKVAAGSHGPPPATEAAARSRACRTGDSSGNVTDGACAPGERSYAASTTPIGPGFTSSQVLIIPAGNQFVLYGPIQGGGRLDNLYDEEVRVGERFAVVESYHSTTGGPPDLDTLRDRDIVVIDMTTLRHVEMSGSSLQTMKLGATATTLTVDAPGCHYETPSEAIR